MTISIVTRATVYLDTNALIYLTAGSVEFKARIETFLRRAVDAQARLATSEWAITEVLVVFVTGDAGIPIKTPHGADLTRVNYVLSALKAQPPVLVPQRLIDFPKFD